jgi:hypothetical protein
MASLLDSDSLPVKPTVKPTDLHPDSDSRRAMPPDLLRVMHPDSLLVTVMLRDLHRRLVSE